MKIRILGESAPYPAPGGATSGYLIETGQGYFCIDCGSGVLPELLRHIPIEDLDGLIITHFHADHVADLGVLQYGVMVSRKKGIRKQPLTVYANEKPSAKFDEVVFQDDVLSVPLNSQSKLELCGATITFCDTIHALPCLAVSVEIGDKKMVFSADSGLSSDLEKLAKDADLFICEASWMANYTGPTSIGHLTTYQAGGIAKRANVKSLCLTHIDPDSDREQMKKEAAEIFNGTIYVAEKGLLLEV